MIEQLLNHIRHHNLCKTTDKILLAVSGGIDSMAMLHLFRQAGFEIGVVHCNFQLRGEASMADEALVNTACVEQNIPFYGKRFDTMAYAKEKNLSIQMAARDLRYSFFETVLRNENYDYIATAHHLNDSIETILLNLTKGTGIDGLTGIPVKKGKVIRPLLFATREMLQNYAALHRLVWREDLSNASDEYERNFIRHQITPRLKEINPNFENTFQNTIKRIKGAHLFATGYIDHFRENALQFKNGQIVIDKGKLLESPAPSVLLWELIKEKGFNFDLCEDIITEHQSGKKFSSSSHDLFVDRETYIIQEAGVRQMSPVKVDEYKPIVQGDHSVLHFSISDKKAWSVNSAPEVAQFDFDQIKFPLLWRTWRPGDFFVPFGSGHSKKVSDFLIDRKLSLPAKNKVTVIESAGTIIWVVGLRIHDHYKVTERTSRILMITLAANKE